MRYGGKRGGYFYRCCCTSPSHISSTPHLTSLSHSSHSPTAGYLEAKTQMSGSMNMESPKCAGLSPIMLEYPSVQSP